MGYWAIVARRAWREALDQLKWTSPLRVVQSLAPTAVSGAVTWLATGIPAFGALAGIGALILVNLAWLIERFWRIPPLLDAELRAKLQTEQEQDRAIERRRRRELVDLLSALYGGQIAEEPLRTELSYGLRRPPVEWLNMKLSEYGEVWSVCNIDGLNYQTFEVLALTSEERASRRDSGATAERP